MSTNAEEDAELIAKENLILKNWLERMSKEVSRTTQADLQQLDDEFSQLLTTKPQPRINSAESLDVEIVDHPKNTELSATVKKYKELAPYDAPPIRLHSTINNKPFGSKSVLKYVQSQSFEEREKARKDKTRFLNRQRILDKAEVLVKEELGEIDINRPILDPKPLKPLEKIKPALVTSAMEQVVTNALYKARLEFTGGDGRYARNTKLSTTEQHLMKSPFAEPIVDMFEGKCRKYKS